jgi:hypothetical protein
LVVNADAVFLKTAKGIEEIETRSHRLGSRLRIALIQVDGHSSVKALQAKIPGDGPALLEELLRDGFIAPVDGTVAASTEAPDTASESESGSATFDLGAAKRRSARTIEALLGPAGDSIAMGIEGTKTFAEFSTRAVRTREMIREMRGETHAKEFWDATGL